VKIGNFEIFDNMKIINLKDKLAEYDNGNYHVTLLRDGTKIRENDLDFFKADFPESIDITFSKKCSQGCKYCYMNCTPDGKVADISNIDHFLDSIHPYTELALNGNDVTDENLMEFLVKCKDRKLICNLTVNQNHFLQNLKLINSLIDCEFVHGVGVSLTKVTDDLINALNRHNYVLHTIAGILSEQDLVKLSDHNIKLLILGYKNIGRGKTYNSVYNTEINNKINYLKNNINHYLDKFRVISFDNLALEQLNVKSWLKNWEEFYMGDEGQFTFYIDLVQNKFYRSSLESESNGFEFNPMTDSVTEMFHKIRDLDERV